MVCESPSSMRWIISHAMGSCAASKCFAHANDRRLPNTRAVRRASCCCSQRSSICSFNAYFLSTPLFTMLVLLERNAKHKIAVMSLLRLPAETMESPAMLIPLGVRCAQGDINAQRYQPPTSSDTPPDNELLRGGGRCKETAHFPPS